MLFNTLAFSALLLGAASATTLNERFVDGLNPLTKRQQFLPGVQTATGETCSNAFGAGYETCTSRDICARDSGLSSLRSIARP